MISGRGGGGVHVCLTKFYPNKPPLKHDDSSSTFIPQDLNKAEQTEKPGFG